MSMSATLRTWPPKADHLACPARDFYHELLRAINRHSLRTKAQNILAAEFGYRKSVVDLATDELKWFNGKLLRLLKEEGLVQ